MGIGMANILERLQVLYGDTARMTIDSHEGKGTLIGFGCHWSRRPVRFRRVFMPSAPARGGKDLRTA